MSFLCPASNTPIYEYKYRLSEISGSVDSLLPLILNIDNFNSVESAIEGQLKIINKKTKDVISDILKDLSNTTNVTCLSFKIDSKRCFNMSASLGDTGLFLVGGVMTFFESVQIIGVVFLVFSQALSKINDLIGRKSIEKEKRESMLKEYLYSSRIIEKDVKEIVDVYERLNEGTAIDITKISTIDIINNNDDKCFTHTNRYIDISSEIDGASFSISEAQRLFLKRESDSSGSVSTAESIRKEILVGELKNRAKILYESSSEHRPSNGRRTVTLV